MPGAAATAGPSASAHPLGGAEMLTMHTKVAELTKQNEFLQEQVKLLSVEISRYQARGTPSGPAALQDDEPVPPWLLDAEYMSPLIRAYQDHIGHLERTVVVLKDEVERLRGDVGKVTSENERLHGEIRRQVEAAAKASREDAMLGTLGTGVFARGIGREEQNEMLQRLDLLTEENNLLIQQQADLRRECERLRTDCARDLQRMEADLEESQADRENLKQQVQAYRSQYGTVEDFTAAREVEREAMTRDLARLQFREGELERDLQEARAQARAAGRELELLRREHEQLSRSAAAMERRVAECAARELAAFQTAKEASEAIEGARLERDQAAAREEQQRREAQRLSDRLRGLTADLHAERQRDADLLRAQHRAQVCAGPARASSSHRPQVEALQAEAAKLEQALNEARARADRAARDKRTVEAELERVSRSLPAGQAKLEAAIREYQERIGLLERERDAAAQDAEACRGQLRKAQAAQAGEAQQLRAQVAALLQRAEEVERELLACTAERARLAASGDEHARALERARKEQEATERRLTKELEAQQRRHEQQVKELTTRLEDAHVAYQASSGELEQILSAQDRIAAKWKDELKSSSARFERIVHELRQDCARLSARNEELGGRVAALLAERAELAASREVYEKTVRSLRASLVSTEQRLPELSIQMSQLVASESAVLAQNKELQVQLERATVEKERAGRQLDMTVRQLLDAKAELAASRTGRVPKDEADVILSQADTAQRLKKLRERAGIK